MQSLNYKARHIFLLAIALGGLFVAAYPARKLFVHNFTEIARADDDEEEEEDDDEEERSETKTKTVYETVTKYVKLPDQVITKKIETTIYDSDGDGIFDDIDPTPNINDNFIVEDSNRNGIVDSYEQYVR